MIASKANQSTCHNNTFSTPDVWSSFLTLQGTITSILTFTPEDPFPPFEVGIPIMANFPIVASLKIPTL